MKNSLLIVFISATVFACNEKKSPEPAPATTETPVPSASPSAPELPQLPNSVVFKNWELGNPANLKLVADTYQSWDSGNAGDMAAFFSDSSIFDLPDGKRYITKNNIQEQLRKWRNAYSETENIPFSLVSLHNKDLNQDWVIAWTWNRWKYKDGVKDSMLYCDNWRIRDGKIEHLSSLQQKPNKMLAAALNKRIPK